LLVAKSNSLQHSICLAKLIYYVNVSMLNKLTANRFMHVEPLVCFVDLSVLQERLAVDAVPLSMLMPLFVVVSCLDHEGLKVLALHLVSSLICL
jgi:hypothetical protein